MQSSIAVSSCGTNGHAELWRVKRLPYTLILSDISSAKYEGAARDVPEGVCIGAGDCCAAHRGGADARDLTCGIPRWKFAANSVLRPGGSGHVCGLAPRRRLEPPILVPGGMRAGHLGSSGPRLDVLRNRAAYGATHGFGGAVLVRYAINLLRAGGISEPG